MDLTSQLRAALARGDRTITAGTRMDSVRGLPRDVAVFALGVLDSRRPVPIVRDGLCRVCLEHADLLCLLPVGRLVPTTMIDYEMRRFASHVAYLIPRHQRL